MKELLHIFNSFKFPAVSEMFCGKSSSEKIFYTQGPFVKKHDENGRRLCSTCVREYRKYVFEKRASDWDKATSEAVYLYGLLERSPKADYK